VFEFREKAEEPVFEFLVVGFDLLDDSAERIPEPYAIGDPVQSIPNVVNVLV
jgi:hypothetical protein